MPESTKPEPLKPQPAQKSGAVPPSPKPAPQEKTRAASPWLPALAGGLVGGLVVAGLFWTLRPQGETAPSPQIAALDQRLTQLEQAAANAPAPAENLAPRLGEVENAAKAAGEAAAQARTEAAEALQAARARPAAAMGTPAPDLGPLDSRIAALETKLPQVEAAAQRPASPPPAAASPEVTRAIAAQALAADLDRSRPLGPALAALERFGVEPALLAPLKPFAESPVPSQAHLIDLFAPQAGALAVGDGPPDADAALSFGERLWKGVSRLVRVRPVTSAGDSPAALVRRIEIGLSQGGFEEALDNWKRLPEPSRQLSAAFGRTLQTRVDAETAARHILAEAVAALPAPTGPAR